MAGVEALRSAWRTRGPRSRAWLGRLSWLAYGCGLAFLYNGYLNSHQANSFTCQRYTDVANAIRALNAGAPILTGMYPHGGGVYPAGYGDDTGPYLYLPVLGHITGTSDPLVLYRWMFIALMSVALILWPLLMRTLFRSRAAGIVLPAILVPLMIGLPGNVNQYWIASWCIALCLPLVLLATRTTNTRHMIALLLGASVVAGFAQSMRANAGIAIPLTGLLVVLWRERAWRRRAAIGLAVVAVYWMAGSGVIRVANAIRDDQIGNHALATNWRTSYGGTDLASRDGGGHVLWHAVYLGLGFEPNRYGIRFADSSGINYAKTVDPNVRYLSPQYATILRNRVLHLALHDPGFVLRTTVDKASIVLATGLGLSFPVLLLLPLIALLGSRTLPIRRWLLLCIPILLVSFAAPTLVVPVDSYMLAFNGALRFVLLLEIGWVVTELAALFFRRSADQPDGPPLYARLWARFALPYTSDQRFAPSAVRPWRAGGARGRTSSSPGGRLGWLTASRRARIAAVVVLIEALGGIWAASSYAGLRGDQFYLTGNQLPLGASFADPSSVRTWSMTGGVPSDWTLLRGRVATANGRTTFDTSSGKFDSELVGPVVTLGAGSYVAEVNGRVIKGGMIVGVESMSGNSPHTISSRGYSYRVPSSTVNTAFHLDRTTSVRVVLSNLSPGSTSHWSLASVRIGSTTSAVANVSPAATQAQRCTPTPAVSAASAGQQLAPTAPAGQRVATWDFSRPQATWTSVHGAGTSTHRSGTTVTSGPGSYAYQLEGPEIRLSPGSYHVDLQASVSLGAIQFLVFDLDTQSLVARSSPIGLGLPGQSAQLSTLPFTLYRTTLMKVVLANDDPSRTATPTWLIRRLSIYRR